MERAELGTQVDVEIPCGKGGLHGGRCRLRNWREWIQRNREHTPALA
jgi:hypothetical protein